MFLFLLKNEMRFLIKKDTKQFLLACMIAQFFYKNFYISAKYKNEWKEHKFWGQKNKKSIFYKNKKLFNIHDIDVNKILVSKEESYGTKNLFKYFIGYCDDDIIRPLCITLPQMIGYVKNFNSNKTMSLKVEDNKLLKKYDKIWGIISDLLNIEFDSEPVYGGNDKYMQTKIKMYEDKVNTNFQSKGVPREDASYKCLSLIMLESVIRVSKKYYPETLLEVCKYAIRKKQNGKP